ncbi:STN domain-containing protein, partial [Acinetobacter baumannii]|nr:STN domain-containing protein [Acinetobacter baumannii]
MHAVRTAELRGTLTVKQALDLLLAGSGFRAVASGPGSYRIVVAPPAPPPRPVARSAAPPPPEPAPADIVVTASKQRVPLLRYPG